MNDFIMEVKNLNFQYINNSFKLNNINLKIKKGEFISIIGPNGSGKTTFLKIISGIIKDYKGEIIISKRDIKKYLQKEFSKKVAYIPQYTDYYFDFSVYEFIKMGRKPYFLPGGILKKEDKEKIFSVMKRYNLVKNKDKKISELSGGEKRIVLIARALTQETEILILDEPTIYLDINYKIKVMDELKKLKNENKTVIIVSHDINLTSEYVDKFILIKNGEVIDYDCVENVLTKKNLEKLFLTDKINVGINQFTGRKNLFILSK